MPPTPYMWASKTPKWSPRKLNLAEFFPLVQIMLFKPQYCDQFCQDLHKRGFTHCLWDMKCLRSLQVRSLHFLFFQSQLDFGQSFVGETEPPFPPLLVSFHRFLGLFSLLPLIYTVTQTNQSLFFIYRS